MYSNKTVTFFFNKISKCKEALEQMLYCFVRGLLLKHMVAHSLSELKIPQVKDILFGVVVLLVFHSIQTFSTCVVFTHVGSVCMRGC